MNASLLIYGLALILLIVAWKRPRNQLKARNLTGNAAVGDNSGTLNQNFTASSTGGEPRPDRVGWMIGIVAVLIAAAQFAYEFYK